MDKAATFNLMGPEITEEEAQKTILIISQHIPDKEVAKELLDMLGLLP